MANYQGKIYLYNKYKFNFSSLIKIILLALLGFALAIFQIFGESPDYFNYTIFFDLVRGSGLEVLTESRFEPGFSLLLVLITRVIESNLIAYSLVVTFSLAFKGLIIDVWSKEWRVYLITILFYFFRFFPLHDLTQLRVSCALAFLLASATLLWRGYKTAGIILSFVAISFHMSVIVAIPMIYIFISKRESAIKLFIIIYILLYLSALIIAEYLSIYIPVLAAYQADGFGDWHADPFAITLLIDWFMILFSLFYWSKLTAVMKQVVVIELVGMSVFYAVLDFPAFSSRLREIFTIFWVFYISDGLKFKIIKTPILMFILSSVSIYSYIYFFKGDFFS